MEIIKKPILSIIIVNWKVKELLKECIISIHDTVKKYDYEIIVIDNDSQDGSIEMIHDDFGDVKLIVNDENIGHSRAMNQGIKISEGDYILLLNPDVILYDNSVDNMVKYLSYNQNVGAVGGKELRPDGKFFWRSRRRYIKPWLEIFALFGVRKLMSNKFIGKIIPDEYMRDIPENQSCRVEILATACMMVKKEVFETIGLLDETFWLMSEDVDISIRINKAGWQIYYLADSPFLHYHGESLSKSKKNMLMIVIAERYILLKKFWNIKIAYCYRIAVFFCSFLYLLFGILSIFFNPGEIKRRIISGLHMLLWSIKPYSTS